MNQILLVFTVLAIIIIMAASIQSKETCIRHNEVFEKELIDSTYGRINGLYVLFLIILNILGAQLRTILHIRDTEMIFIVILPIIFVARTAIELFTNTSFKDRQKSLLNHFSRIIFAFITVITIFKGFDMIGDNKQSFAILSCKLLVIIFYTLWLFIEKERV